MPLLAGPVGLLANDQGVSVVGPRRWTGRVEARSDA